MDPKAVAKCLTNFFLVLYDQGKDEEIVRSLLGMVPDDERKTVAQHVVKILSDYDYGGVIKVIRKEYIDG